MKRTALVLLTLLPLAAGAQTDTDGDGVLDYLDNCTLAANVAQIDVDGDYYGNRCDPDFNNDGYVTAADYVLFRAHLNTADPLYDLNGDGYVTAADYLILRGYLNKTPGPSEPAEGTMSSVSFGPENIGLNPPDTTVGDGLRIVDYRVVGNAWTGISVGPDVALELDPRVLQNPPIVGIQLQFRKLTDPITSWSAKWVDVWAHNTTTAPATLQILQRPTTCQGGVVNWQSFPSQVISAGEMKLIHITDTMCGSTSMLLVQLSGPAGLVVDRVDFNLMP